MQVNRFLSPHRSIPRPAPRPLNTPGPGATTKFQNSPHRQLPSIGHPSQLCFREFVSVDMMIASVLSIKVAIRIVVDTNVLVSALTSASGASREVLRRCLRRECEPVIGHKLFLEIEDALGRKELFATCPLSATQRDRLFAAFASVCTWTKIYYLWRPNLRDEGDNHVLELAVAAGAGVIVTHNARDFVGSDLRFPGVRVLRPAEFLKEMR